MAEIRRLDVSEVDRLAEIDRSERITVGYRMRDGQLVSESVDWDVPPWSPDGQGDHSVAANVAATRDDILNHAGVVFAAFEGERLVGVATYVPRLTATMGQLAFLHVSRPYRRRGIASKLLAEVLRLAREDGATSVYVSGTPSASAVGFYMSQGFAPTADPPSGAAGT